MSVLSPPFLVAQGYLPACMDANAVSLSPSSPLSVGEGMYTVPAGRQNIAVSGLPCPLGGKYTVPAGLSESRRRVGGEGPRARRFKLGPSLSLFFFLRKDGGGGNFSAHHPPTTGPA